MFKQGFLPFQSCFFFPDHIIKYMQCVHLQEQQNEVAEQKLVERTYKIRRQYLEIFLDKVHYLHRMSLVQREVRTTLKNLLRIK